MRPTILAVLEVNNFARDGELTLLLILAHRRQLTFEQVVEFDAMFSMVSNFLPDVGFTCHVSRENARLRASCWAT